ncbi:MAG: CHAP domain-containing protein [Chloroflexi bacterium]|nr:MAG: CHAP domain-containing protein [Chloroflexota bacterium]TMD55021.1 MAG: CHAP domain-containing protein [Chloroflexota bacterium]
MVKRIALLVVVAVTAAALLSTPVTSASAAAPDSVASAQSRLDDLNNRVEQAGGKVDLANHKLLQDQKLEADLNVQIAALARLQYKRPSMLVQFLQANSLSQVLGDVSSDRLMDQKQKNLVLQMRDLHRQDQQARDEAAISLAVITASRDEAQKILNEAVAARNAELAARAAALAAMQRPASIPAAWSGQGPWPNRFAYGYCTWYVANKRYIPWLGNAIDWWPNARAYGYAEGYTPQVGAVMVTRESGYGHVAYVEAVYPNGSWLVSEMNFIGWNRVSTRIIFPGTVPLVGFIY